MCVNIICWAVWGALFFAAYYLDKKIPERKLRYSNPWIEGVFSVIYFLCYMLWFFCAKMNGNIADVGTDVALGDNCCWIDCGVLCESFSARKRGEVLFNAFKTIEIVSQQRYNK